MAILPQVFVCLAWACSSALATETSPATDCGAGSEATSGTRTLLQVAESSDARAAMRMKGGASRARGKSNRRHMKRSAQTSKELDQDDLIKLANEVLAQIDSEDTEDIDSDAGDASFSDEHNNGSSASEATLPPLSEEGYVAVANLHNDRKMEGFIERLAVDMDLKLIDTGGLKGLAPYYSGRKATQDFETLKLELWNTATQPDGWLVRRAATPHNLLQTDSSQSQQRQQSQQDEQSEQSQQSQEEFSWMQRAERLPLVAAAEFQKAPFFVCLMGFILVIFCFDEIKRTRRADGVDFLNMSPTPPALREDPAAVANFAVLSKTQLGQPPTFKEDSKVAENLARLRRAEGGEAVNVREEETASVASTHFTCKEDLALAANIALLRNMEGGRHRVREDRAAVANVALMRKAEAGQYFAHKDDPAIDPSLALLRRAKGEQYLDLKENGAVPPSLALLKRADGGQHFGLKEPVNPPLSAFMRKTDEGQPVSSRDDEERGDEREKLSKLKTKKSRKKESKASESEH